MREKEKKWERKNARISIMWLSKFLLPECVSCVLEVGCAKKKTNYGNTIAKIREEKKNCGNTIAEIREEKKNSGCRNLGRNLKNKCYVHNIFTTFSQQITCD